MPERIAGKVLYGIDEVAAALGVTPRSVYAYLKDGRLRGIKYGRSWHISKENLQAFLDGERKDGGAASEG